MRIEAEVLAVIAEARTWCGTPYHHHAAVRGAGVDCAQILLETYAACGLIERFTPEPYPPDWHMHRSEERYVATIERFAREYTPGPRGPLAADVVVWRYGRTFSHGGIVTGNPQTGALGWPWIVHAFAPSLVVEEIDVTGSPLDGRAMRAFTLWPDSAQA